MQPHDKTMMTSLIRWTENLPDVQTLLSYALFGWIVAPVLQFVERFLWSDWEFVGFLVVMLTMDTITAAIVEYKRGKLTSLFFQDLLLKFFAYSVILVVIHVISNHTVKGNPNSVLATVIPFLDAVVYAAILFKEALSVNENLTLLGFPLLPKFLIRKFKAFQERGVDAIKLNDDEEKEA